MIGDPPLALCGEHYVATSYIQPENPKQGSFAYFYQAKWLGETTTDAMWNVFALVHIFAKALQSAATPTAQKVREVLRENARGEVVFATDGGDNFRLDPETLMPWKDFQLGRVVLEDRIRVHPADYTETQLPPEPFPDDGIVTDWEDWANVIYLISDVFPDLERRLGLCSIQRARDWLLNSENQPFNPVHRTTWCQRIEQDGEQFREQLSALEQLAAGVLHEPENIFAELSSKSYLHKGARKMVRALRDLHCADGDLERFRDDISDIPGLTLAVAKGKALASRHDSRIYLFDLVDYGEKHRKQKVRELCDGVWIQFMGMSSLLSLLHEDLKWELDGEWNVSVFRSLAWAHQTDANDEDGQGGSVTHYVGLLDPGNGQSKDIAYCLAAIGVPMADDLPERRLSTSMLFQEFPAGHSLRRLISSMRVLFCDLGTRFQREKYGKGVIHFENKEFDFNEWFATRATSREEAGLWVFRWRVEEGVYNIAVVGWKLWPNIAIPSLVEA